MARDLGCSKGTLAIVRILQRRGTLQVGDLAHVLRVDISVASRQVSQLVDEGLVERTVDDEDRRARTVGLSPRGRSLALEMGAALDRRMDEIFTDWSAPEIETAISTLERLTLTISRFTEPTSAEPPEPADRELTHA